MFYYERGAAEIVDNAVDKYESHFEERFPIYDFLDMTSSGKYDFSVAGSKRLETFIDERIKAEAKLSVPDNFDKINYR